MSKDKLIRKFDKQAGLYEVRRKKLTERDWRQNLVSCAKGKVLEVAVGAGANLPFYPRSIDLVAVDFSPEMLKRAEAAAADYGIQAKFSRSDVESLSFPDDSFDTIVSTLSFCGYEDPETVLKKFIRWCRRDGQILLMEHGISSNRLVGGIQTLMNPVFRTFTGCHFDRDILQILEQPELKINKIEPHLLGAVHLVWAQPDKQS